MAEGAPLEKKVSSKATLKFVKIKCHRCGKVNLIPVFKRLQLFKTVKCESCGEVLTDYIKKNT